MKLPIGLFYGSTTCYTQMVAEQIQQLLGKENCHLHDLSTTSIQACLSYDSLIFGIPTWDYGELQEDWDDCWDELTELNLGGRECAIFGLGDQGGYPDWFQDAMGYLYHQLIACGAKLQGHWPIQGYQFNESQALCEGDRYFVGLALDEETQPELTENRILEWLKLLGLTDRD